MGRQLRDTAPEKFHVVSCRTIGAELLLVPKPDLNEIVGGVFAKYAKEQEIDLYALSVQSNHYHSLCRAQHSNLPLFQQNVNKEITRRVNRYLGRDGSLWARRYDDLIALENCDILDSFLYIVTNPVKHGLVRHPKHWPGINSYHQNLGAKPHCYAFTDFSEYHKAKKREEARGKVAHIEEYQERNELKYAVLPMFANLSPEVRKATIEKLLEERTRHLVRKREKSGKSFSGRKKILAQPIQGTFPKEISRTPRPSCWSKIPEAIKQFKADEAERVSRYAVASWYFRQGVYDVAFPPHTIRPPSHHFPRTNPNRLPRPPDHLNV